MAFLLPLLLRVLPFIAAAAVAWYGWHRVDNWCNSACTAQESRADQAAAAIKVAQERATWLALKWSEAINKTEVRYVEVVRERTASAAGLRERAGRIRPATDSVSVRVPADALRVLDDAAKLANNSAAPAVDQRPTAPFPDAAGPAETTLSDWVAFAVDAAEAYRDAADKHSACVAAYESLTTQQEK